MMELLRVVSCEDDMAGQQNERTRITGTKAKWVYTSPR